MHFLRGGLGAVVILFGSLGLFVDSSAQAYASSSYAYGLNPPASFVGGEGGFSTPAGIAVDEVAAGYAGDVYVVDQTADRVERFSATGSYQGEFNGSGTLPGEAGKKAAAGMFEEPTWLAVDNSTDQSDPSRGDVYVVDSGHQAVEKFSPEGEFLSSLPAPPEFGSGPTPAGFYGEDLLNGIAVDESGNVWILNFLSVDEYSDATSNAFVTGWETGLFSSHPGFGVDGAGSVYLSGSFTKALHKYSASGASEGTVSGECAEECTSALAVDQAGRQLFAGRLPSGSTEPEIVATDTAGAETQAPFAVKQIQGIGGLAVDSATHTLYATDPVAEDVKIFQGVIPATFTAPGVSEETVNSATVSATVDSNGLQTTCKVEYGTDPSYGTSMPCNPESVGPGTGPITVRANLTGLVGGHRYHYRFVGMNSTGIGPAQDQSFRLTPPPSVDEQPGFATGVTQSSATLNGTIDSYDIPTSYHFVYGTTSAYGSSIPIPDLYTEAKSSEPVIPQTIDGLEPGTTYHFALVATAPGGTVGGPDETFTTPRVPLPEAVTGGSAGPSQGAVTLTGSVNPNGWDTTYQFQYGTTAAYGASWPSVPVQAGQFNGLQGVTIYLQNLQPTTTYHYRLLATNPAGTVYGAAQTFTTSAYPVAAIAEPPGASIQLSKPATKTTPKALTNSQKLTNALKACKKEAKKKRASCEKQARKKFSQTKKKK
jgi:hypothetical protein